MTSWKWSYTIDPYGFSSKRRYVILKANRREDAIWMLYEYIVRKFGTHIPRWGKEDYYGFDWLFDPDIFNNDYFDCYNLGNVSKEIFIKVFEQRIAEEHVKDFVSLREISERL